MCNCSKRKHSCMDCKHFHHSEEVLDGYNVEDLGGIIIRTPKHKTVPMHCDHDNEKFQAWWEANKDKPSTESVAPEECFELDDFLKPLEEMIQLGEKILDGIKNK